MTEPPAKQADELVEVLSGHQPTLPTLELPEYHGRKPVGMKSGISGMASRVTRPHTVGDRVVLVIEARVIFAGHESTDDGLQYVEKYKTDDLFELPGDQGSRMLTLLRSLYRTADDATKGRRPIPELGDVGYADASGVVLTPPELAELRGDPVRAILSPELTPVVVVYNDNERLAWPDDYPADQPRPQVGDVFTDNGITVEVVKLLDHRTGETLPTPGAIADLPEPGTPGTQGWPASTLAEKPEADEFDGDLGDGIEWSDKPTDVGTDADLKAQADAFVACNLGELAEKLGEVDDLEMLARYTDAEKFGRNRSGAFDLIESRIAFVADLPELDAHEGTGL